MISVSPNGLLHLRLDFVMSSLSSDIPKTCSPQNLRSLISLSIGAPMRPIFFCANDKGHKNEDDLSR